MLKKDLCSFYVTEPTRNDQGSLSIGPCVHERHYEGSFVFVGDDIMQKACVVLLACAIKAKLWLIDAKKGDNVLKSSDPRVKRLTDGDIPAEIKVIVKQNGEMDASYCYVEHSIRLQ
ncbi:hypothetical protein AC1031_012833 [Aphanomyces cochlioides]|nr:hypothetical protein AC1031_012833 [Aphanomyces cochlioides]